MNDLSAPSSSLQSFVREYYGRLLASSADLETNACCAGGAPPAFIAEALTNVHPDVEARFYGCGFPIPHALAGVTAVDLGCGTGRDAFVLAQLVGAEGLVHGVDMTAEQLELARGTESWHADRFGYPRPNTRFHQGYIEDLRELGFHDESVDVVVSNCVVNLSPRKDLVLAEVARGDTRFAPYFYVTRPSPAHFGAFPCDPTLAARQYDDAPGGAGAACC